MDTIWTEGASMAKANLSCKYGLILKRKQIFSCDSQWEQFFLPVMKSDVVIANDDVKLSIFRNPEEWLESSNVVVKFDLTAPETFVKNVSEDEHYIRFVQGDCRLKGAVHLPLPNANWGIIKIIYNIIVNILNIELVSVFTRYKNN